MAARGYHRGSARGSADSGGRHRGGGPGRGGGGGCFACGQLGHRANECPSGDGGGRGRGRGSRGSRGSYQGSRGRGGYHERGGGDVGGVTEQMGRLQLDTESLQTCQEIECNVRRSPFAMRSGFGQRGEKVKLVSNHFRVNVPDITVYHYDLKIESIDARRREEEEKKSSSSGDSSEDLTGREKPGRAEAVARPVPRAIEGAKKKGKQPGKPEKYEPPAGGPPGVTEAKIRRLKQKDNRKIFDAFLEQNLEEFGNIRHPVYDGLANVITAQRLRRGSISRTVNVHLDGRDVQFKVTIALTKPDAGGGEINLAAIRAFYDGQINEVPQIVYQALEIIFRHGPTFRRVPIGRSLYLEQPNLPSRHIGDNKVVGFGHYQSINLTRVGVTLTVDRSATPFYNSAPLLEHVRNLPGFGRQDIIMTLQSGRAGNLLNNLTGHVKGLKVFTNHLGYRQYFVIDELSQSTPSNTTFASRIEGTDELQEMSVAQYFHNKYHRDVDPNLPCVIPKGGNRRYVPLDMCFIAENQPVPKGKLLPENVGEMVKICGGQSPHERFNEIYNAAHTIKNDSRDILMEFDIDVSTEPVALPGRVLPIPSFEGLPVDFRTRGQFVQPSSMANWMIINLDGQNVTQDMLRNFVENLQGEGRKVRFTISDPRKCVTSQVNRPDDVRNLFNKAKSLFGKELQLIMFILPERNATEIYGAIKHCGDVESNLVTQCIKAKNIYRPPRSGIESNVILKLNPKLGGVNRRMKPDPPNAAVTEKPKILADFRNQPTMIMGVDVTHPAPADKLSSSVAAFVGTYDENHALFHTEIRVQPRCPKRPGEEAATERIIHFSDAFRDLIKNFKAKNKRYPKHIIYYRDGVSEGEFFPVLDHEREAMLQVFGEIPELAGSPPQLTYIVVQKNHHTRFRPQRDEDGDVRDRGKGNIRAGTVIDTHVTDPINNDFYLCSHRGIQGTSRPSHYTVLLDDHRLNADTMQKLTYYLCYMFSRSRGSIAVPAAVRYAHLAAYRARIHIINLGMNFERRHDETEDQRMHREGTFCNELGSRIRIGGLADVLYYN